MRILVLEDNKDIRKLYRAILNEIPHVELLILEDPPMALDTVQLFSPDLVITSLTLRSTSGIDFIRNIRNFWSKQKLPIIVVSGMSPSLIPEETTSLINVFVNKPFNPDELLCLIESLLPSQDSSLIDEKKVPEPATFRG
jgi:DNA-binding response OmpR family regulator